MDSNLKSKLQLDNPFKLHKMCRFWLKIVIIYFQIDFEWLVQLQFGL